MVVFLAALALLGPPRATINGTALAVSSWCWGAKCGAPIAASAKTVVAARGSTVTVQFPFRPIQVHVAVTGRRVPVSLHGSTATWSARAGGGVTVSVTGLRGWVTYVARLRLR